MKMRPFTPTVATLLLSLLLPLGSASAQDQYAEQIRVQLEEASRAFQNNGFTGLLGDGGALDNQTYEDFEVTLRTGVEYAIIAVCDEDCSDIDLAIYDGYDNLITADETEDDAPVVTFTVTQGGKFTLRVTMYACSENPCYYGVGLYGR